MKDTAVASVEQAGRDRAIVMMMGGSIAGLSAARVLSDHFREVILVERDQFGAVGEHRRGVPQGRHTHGRKFAQSFFARAAKIVDAPWSMAAGNDLRMPDVPGKRTAIGRFLNWYIAKLNMTARHDMNAVMAFQKAKNLLAPPQSLLKPSLIARVLSTAFSPRRVARASTKSAHQTA